MNADELFARAQIDTVFDNFAMNVSAHYEALIATNMPQALVEQLVRDYSWQWWNSAWTGIKHD